MKKRAFFTIVICTLISSVMMPFSISANQSLPSPFVGVNIYAIDIETNYKYTSISAYTETLTSNTKSLECYTVLPNNAGCQLYLFGNDNSTSTTPNQYFSFTASVPQQTINSVAFNSTLYEYEFILDNYYVGYINLTINNNSDLYYVNGTSFTYSSTSNNLSITVNNYELHLLDSNKTMWAYPIESYSFINQFFTNNFDQVGLTDNYNYIYPIFMNDSSKYFAKYTYTSTSNTLSIIFGIYSSTINNISTFNSNFTYNSNYTLQSIDSITASTGFRIVHCKFLNNGSGGNINMTFSQNIKVIPIYIGSTSNSQISTDFALIYGLSNRLLDNLDIIANGTSSSNNIVSEFNQESNEMNQTISDYNSIENQFNDDFNTNINAITPSDNGLNLMGSRFLNSANWVKTQFDRMTNNTPFGSVLGFSLVLGLGLLIIGRVLG